MEATLVYASLGMQAAAKFVKVRLKPILYLFHFIYKVITVELLIRPICMSVSNGKICQNFAFGN